MRMSEYGNTVGISRGNWFPLVSLTANTPRLFPCIILTRVPVIKGVKPVRCFAWTECNGLSWGLPARPSSPSCCRMIPCYNALSNPHSFTWEQTNGHPLLAGTSDRRWAVGRRRGLADETKRWGSYEWQRWGIVLRFKEHAWFKSLIEGFQVGCHWADQAENLSCR